MTPQILVSAFLLNANSIYSTVYSSPVGCQIVSQTQQGKKETHIGHIESMGKASQLYLQNVS